MTLINFFSAEKHGNDLRESQGSLGMISDRFPTIGEVPHSASHTITESHRNNATAKDNDATTTTILT